MDTNNATNAATEAIAVLGRTGPAGERYKECLAEVMVKHPHARILTDQDKLSYAINANRRADDAWCISAFLDEYNVSHLYVVTRGNGDFPLPRFMTEYTPEYYVGGEDFEYGEPVMVPAIELPVSTDTAMTVYTPVAVYSGERSCWHVKRRHWAHVTLANEDRMGWTLDYERCECDTKIAGVRYEWWC